jgi:hypothetical protein
MQDDSNLIFLLAVVSETLARGGAIRQVAAAVDAVETNVAGASEDESKECSRKYEPEDKVVEAGEAYGIVDFTRDAIEAVSRRTLRLNHVWILWNLRDDLLSRKEVSQKAGERQLNKRKRTRIWATESERLYTMHLHRHTGDLSHRRNYFSIGSMDE